MTFQTKRTSHVKPNDRDQRANAPCDCFAYGGKLLGIDAGSEIHAIDLAGNDYAAIQKAHRGLLLATLRMTAR